MVQETDLDGAADNRALTGRNVRELQSLAIDGARRPSQRRPRARLSRAAQLHLIDELSRRGGAGLGLAAGAAILLAVLYAGVAPWRGATWLALFAISLYACRKLRTDFRAGARLAGRPFRWRAQYTAALSVLSASIGAGAVLLAPANAVLGQSMQIAALAAAALVGVGVFNAAHARSAEAAVAPGLALVLFASARALGPSLAAAAMLALCAAACAGVFILVRRFERDAERRFPRTRRARASAERLAPADAKATDAPAGAATSRATG